MFGRGLPVTDFLIALSVVAVELALAFAVGWLIGQLL
jgi:hypothetical protein